jgi:hypothetical protein
MEVISYNQFTTAEGRLIKADGYEWLPDRTPYWHIFLWNGYSIALLEGSCLYKAGRPVFGKDIRTGLIADCFTPEMAAELISKSSFQLNKFVYCLAHAFCAGVIVNQDCPSEAGGNLYLGYYNDASVDAYQELLHKQLVNFGMEIRRTFSSYEGVFYEANVSDEVLNLISVDHELVKYLKNLDFSGLMSFLFGCLDACSLFDRSGSIVLSYHQKIPSSLFLSKSRVLPRTLSEVNLTYYYRMRVYQNRNAVYKSFLCLLDMLALPYWRWKRRVLSGFARVPLNFLTLLPFEILDFIVEHSLFFKFFADEIITTEKPASMDFWYDTIRVQHVKHRYKYRSAKLRRGFIDDSELPLFLRKLKVGVS